MFHVHFAKNLFSGSCVLYDTIKVYLTVATTARCRPRGVLYRDACGKIVTGDDPRPISHIPAAHKISYIKATEPLPQLATFLE